MIISKKFPVKAALLCTSLFTAAACSNSNPTANLGAGIGAGVVVSELGQAAGLNRGAANMLGVAVGLATTGSLNEQARNSGNCVETSVATRGQYGSNWQENRRCTRTTSGYKTGPL